MGEWSVLHANKGQNTRINAFENFQSGNLRGIVATDVVARGIDIAKVSHVINFDLPVMHEEYIHRVGRTGRAKEEGIAITFATPPEQYQIPKLEALIGKKITRLEIPPEVKVHETVGEEKQNYARELDRLKQKDDPTFQGAFHERKGALGGKRPSRKVVKAYKFAGKRKNHKK